MNIETSQVAKLYITDVPRLDPITVLLEDLGPNQGKMIVECYGRSWSAYWGSMGGTLPEFLRRVSSEYIADRMYHGERQVFDAEGLETHLRKELLRQRRARLIGLSRARDLWDTIDAAWFESPMDLDEDMMETLFGEDWRGGLPVKTHPVLTYLTRIIEAVKEGVTQAFPEKPDEKQ